MNRGLLGIESENQNPWEIETDWKREQKGKKGLKQGQKQGQKQKAANASAIDEGGHYLDRKCTRQR